MNDLPKRGRTFLKYFRDKDKDGYLICSHVASDSVNIRDIKQGLKHENRRCCIECMREGFLTTKHLIADLFWKYKGFDGVMKINHKAKANHIFERTQREL